MRVPGFLVHQFYVAGSLQLEGDGFRLQARNGVGDGTLVGIKAVSVDGQPIDLDSISATLEGSDTVHHASDIDRASPVAFSKGDVVTFHVAGYALAPGPHDLEVELYEVNLGLVSLGLTDTIREA